MRKFFNLNNISAIHFIGIGGMSMSALARYCIHCGKKVSGSDLKPNDITKDLEKMGAKISYVHRSKNVNMCDLVVYTGAVSENNVELVQARLQNILCIERSEFLGVVSRQFAQTISIAGTHGKTTTTALVSKILIMAGLDPCVHLGGCADFLQFNYRKGKKVFVTEACEYRESFLSLRSFIGVILNVEKEHLDYYRSFKHEILAFKSFAKNSKNLICDYDLLKTFSSDRMNNDTIQTVSLSQEKANWYAKNICKIKNGGYIFDCFHNGEFYARLTTTLIGTHNIYDILSAVSVAYMLNVSKKVISTAVFEFAGVQRRMQKVSQIKDTNIYIDYAHHPTEIFALFRACEEFDMQEKLIIFQPHTYSRTATLLNDFLKVFCEEKSDLIILPTYSAREKKSAGITSRELCGIIKSKKSNVLYKGKLSLISFIRQNLDKYKYIFFVGAGDLDVLAKKI